MKYKVLVVDDSSFFQHRLTEIINEHPELEVCGIAANGREAVEKALSLRPDLISMDYEMPVLNGVSAVREIMQQRPVPILMFSSMTYEGARITLEALAAGAVDFIPKDFAEVSRNSHALKSKLHERMLEILKNHRLGQGPAPARTASPRPNASSSPVSSTGSSFNTSPSLSRSPLSSREPRHDLKNENTRSEATLGESSNPDPGYFDRLRSKVGLLVIGASTGGPVALTELLTRLPQNFSLPILLVQHMPENFTKAFAERLNRLCKIEVKEGADGDRLRAGLAILAPGGKQMLLDQRNRGCVRILPGDERVNYRPSLDVTFGSAANAYGDRTLGIVLTGMGSDGCEGARLLKGKGAAVWTQDEASCVIFGMPMAVARAKLSDCVLPLDEFGPKLVELF